MPPTQAKRTSANRSAQPRPRRAPSKRTPTRRSKPISPVKARSLSTFDRFAGKASEMVARAPFFAFCVVLVVIWLPSYFAFKNVDTWQLIINTVTTIVTFLLVALLQNSQRRSDEALQDKLNAIADGIADVLAGQRGDNRDVSADIQQLRQAVGLENREGS